MKKILIVDDSPILRSTIKTVIERAGYEVCGEAANSEEAMDFFTKTKPDLILLDILLPGESGLDILKKLKSIDNEVKVLIVTAVNQDMVSEEAKKLGAKGILYKPFDLNELVKAVEGILN